MNFIHKRNVSWLISPSFLELYETSNLPSLPVSSVFCFIVNDQNEILFIKNIKPNRSWEIPGGHVESGETPVESLLRECFEEAMALIEEPKLFAIHQVTNLEPNSSYPPKSCQGFYVARLKELNPFQNNYEIGDRKFVSQKDLNSIDWCNDYQDLVSLALKNI